MLIEELYDALIEAGASEAKAIAAARAIADYEKRFGRLETEVASFRSDFRRELTEFHSEAGRNSAEFEGKLTEFRSDVDKQFVESRAYVDKHFAESRAYVEKEFTDIRGTLKLHNWMMGTTIALLTAMFLKMFY